MLKKTIVICILCLTLILNFNIVKGNVFDGEYNDEEIETAHFRNFVLDGNKGDNIHFNIKSNIPVNCYIIKNPYTNMIPVSVKVENNSDDFFKNAELTKENQTKFDFKWTQPTNQDFLLVIYNPNDENATVSIRHDTPISDRMRLACYFIIFVAIAIFVIIFFVYYRNKMKNQPQYPSPHQQSSPQISNKKHD